MKLLLYSKYTKTMKKQNSTVVSFDTDFIAHLIAEKSNEAIAEAIINSGANLGIVLKGVFDYRHPILFHAGTDAISTERIWDYSTEESREKADTIMRDMGLCLIVGFNPYTNIYTVNYQWINRKGEPEIRVADVEADKLAPVYEMH
jgi:hypothetical protein